MSRPTVRWHQTWRHWVVRDYAGAYVGSYADQVAALEVAERLMRDRARRADPKTRAEVDHALSDYYAWCEWRGELERYEATGDFADLSDDWHDSDDSAVVLMHRLAALLR